MEVITHTESLDIFVTGGEGGGGGGFYPSDEPLYSNGDGSPLSVSIQMEMYAEGRSRTNRQTSLTIEGQMAYWLRWGWTISVEINLKFPNHYPCFLLARW